MFFYPCYLFFFIICILPHTSFPLPLPYMPLIASLLSHNQKWRRPSQLGNSTSFTLPCSTHRRRCTPLGLEASPSSKILRFSLLLNSHSPSSPTSLPMLALLLPMMVSYRGCGRWCGRSCPHYWDPSHSMSKTWCSKMGHWILEIGCSEWN